MTLTFGSLFSGIGGLDLGFERAGMECRWQSEIEPYCCRVLAKHWPDVPNLGDINGIEWERVEPVDVICGGYPCQPFSLAGARNGTDDPRHLWPRFRDAIRVLRPRYAVLENVTGHLSLGFGQVLADLAQIGYDTQWDCIPAASVGAPHLRDRIFVIATRNDGMDTNSDSKPNVTINATTQPWPTPMGNADNSRNRTPGHEDQRQRPASNQIGRGQRLGNGTGQSGQIESSEPQFEWRTWWQTEPRVGRVADGIPHRVDRLRGLGNAVVPQVAEHVAHIVIHNHL